MTWPDVPEVPGSDEWFVLYVEYMIRGWLKNMVRDGATTNMLPPPEAISEALRRIKEDYDGIESGIVTDEQLQEWMEE